jgi:hypothetical protein
MLKIKQSIEDKKIMSMDTSNMSPTKKKKKHIFVHVKWKSLKNVLALPYEMAKYFNMCLM